MEREITHSCGHPQRHYVAGFYAADRDREAVRLSRRPCASCWRRRCQASAEAQAGPGGEALHGVTLPPLSGTPRQVAWAEDIRRRHLTALPRLEPGAIDGVAAAINAAWWIERRTAPALTIVAHLGAVR